MIPEKSYQRQRWKLQRDFVWGRTPDTGCHRYEIVVPKGLRIVVLVQVLADALLLGCLRGMTISFGAAWICLAFCFRRQQVKGELVEPDNVEDHPPHTKTEDVLLLREDRG